MAAAYNLQLVNFQVMNHTYIFRSSIGCCCSIPTAWSEELESLLIIVQLCICILICICIFRSSVPSTEKQKTRIGCRTKDFVIDILGSLLSIRSKITMAYEYILKCGMACHLTDTIS